MEKQRAEGDKLQGKFDAMRAQDQADGEALAAAERRLQAISSGMYSSGDGEDATLQEQLISKYIQLQKRHRQAGKTEKKHMRST